MLDAFHSVVDCKGGHKAPLWSDPDHWPYVPGVCSVTGKSSFYTIPHQYHPWPNAICELALDPKCGQYYWALSILSEWKQLWEISTCIGWLMLSWRACVIVKQMQSNSKHGSRVGAYWSFYSGTDKSEMELIMLHIPNDITGLKCN